MDLNLSEKELVKALIDGDVRFTKSKKNNSFKVYYFDCKTESGKLFSCKATMPQESFISEIIFSNEDAKKNKKTRKLDLENLFIFQNQRISFM